MSTHFVHGTVNEGHIADSSGDVRCSCGQTDMTTSGLYCPRCDRILTDNPHDYGSYQTCPYCDHYPPSLTRFEYETGIKRGTDGIRAVKRGTQHAYSCGTCGRNWLEDRTPAGRCPWEYDHTATTYSVFHVERASTEED